MVDTPAIAAATFGGGRVLLFSPHPEYTADSRPLLKRAVLLVARKPGDTE
jgi:hypothetical protein